MSENEDNEKGGITAKIIVTGKEEIKKLTEENERLTQQLKSIAEKEFELKKQAAKQKYPNIPEDVESPEELEDFIKSEKEIEEKLDAKEKEERTRNPALNPELGAHAGSGKAPLSGEPSGNLSTVKEYANFEEMMEDVRQRAHSSDKAVAQEAQEIQQKLLEKLAKDKKIHDFEVELDLGKIVEEKKKKDEELRKKGAKVVDWREL